MVSTRGTAWCVVLCLFLPMPVFSLDEPVRYPATRKVPHEDVYFGARVADPYRWLEDDTSGEVGRWVKEENALTSAYLKRIPFRAQLKARLEEVFDYPKYSRPFKKFNTYVFSKNNGLQNQSVLYIQTGRDGAPEVLIDPNTFSVDGTARLAGYTFSDDMHYLAYGISHGGSDWREVFIMEVQTRTVLRDRLRWVKFSSYAWKGAGFYYSRFPAPIDTGKALSASNINESVWYHRLGTEQSADVLVYEDPAHPKRTMNVETTEDQHFEILYVQDAATGARGNALSIRDTRDADPSFHPVVSSFEDNFTVIDDVGERLLVETNRSAPNNRLVLIDPHHAQEKDWKVILPERAEPLRATGTAGGKIFAVYMKDVASHAFVYDTMGAQENEITFPAFGTVSTLAGEPADSTIFYTFTSFTFPPTIYEYNLRTRESAVFRRTEVKFDPKAYVTSQEFYTSKDGTKVPMFIVHRAGITLDGRNPTLLYAYGGFAITIVPAFNALLIPLLDQGVVYASANIRGGGEYGENWHQAGTKLRKQNVFDDFIAAAEYLIAHKYTSSSKLAIRGGSNGGLLVGAVMTQRPGLCRVALPEVGVMDMLRYQRFTIGATWAADFGSSDDSTQFQYIRKYSPLQNIRETAYPATLVTTADHDDRVVPAHSFKFIATLQEKQRGTLPVLIRIDTQSGHGASSTAKQIEETADLYSFMLYNLGVFPKF